MARVKARSFAGGKAHTVSKKVGGTKNPKRVAAAKKARKQHKASFTKGARKAAKTKAKFY